MEGWSGPGMKTQFLSHFIEKLPIVVKLEMVEIGFTCSEWDLKY